ncbi:MAG: PorT family protein [Bacteroidales bacterium]|nr:PorT family protein [Bacteroidales bacterium]
MKKIVLSLILVNLLLGVYSQNIEFKSGLNLSKALYFVGDTSVFTNRLPGINAGVVGEFKLANNLYLSTSVGFSQRGYKINDSGVHLKYRYNYIDIPASIVYKFELDNINFNFEFGPYLSTGINGKYIQGGKTSKIHFGSAANQVKRFDFGLNLGYCLEFEKITLRLNYMVGFINFANNGVESLKNRAFTFSVGYKIKQYSNQ